MTPGSQTRNVRLFLACSREGDAFLATHYPHAVAVPTEGWEAAFAWCDEQFVGDKAVMSLAETRDTRPFHFRDMDDAALFKLFWG